MPITKDQLENWFTHHTPTNEDQRKYAAIRAASMHLAEVIVNNTLFGADQLIAVQKVREAMMAANAAVACNKPRPLPEDEDT